MKLIVITESKNDIRLISLRFKTNSYRILVGLLVQFDSYSYSCSYTYRSRDDRGRGRGGKVRDLWREGSRWPSVHRPWPSLITGETVAVGAQTLSRY